MDALMRRPRLVLVSVAVLLVLVLAGQSLADALLADASFTTTGQAMGRAGFAYLTGIRTFAAAVIWNRIDPIYHEYYGGRPLNDQTQSLPMIKLVTVLAPDFEDAYNVGAWIVVQRGLVDEGVQLAREGVDNNPASGLLRTNYAQVLWLFADDPEAALEQAEIAFSDEVVWRDPIEQHDSYAILRSLFEQNGEPDKAEAVLAEIERLDVEIGDDLPAGSHDHDGDGVPDH